GDGDVSGRLVRRVAPFDPAERGAFAEALLPENLSFIVGIESPGDARFLPGDDSVLAVRHLAQNRRSAEVEIGAVLFGAIRMIRAADDEVALGLHLARPEHAA